MAFTTTNPIVTSDVNVLGLIIYFRPAGQTPFIDLGHVQNPQRTVDQQEQDIQSARTGKLLTIKKLTVSLSKGLTFETLSATSSEILELHRGRRRGTAPTAPLGVFIPDDVTPTEGELLIVQNNAETGGPIKVEFRPKAQLKGTDEQSGDGENPAILTFDATVLQNETYRIPASLAADTPLAPLGFTGVTTAGNLAAVLSAIGGP